MAKRGVVAGWLIALGAIALGAIALVVVLATADTAGVNADSTVLFARKVRNNTNTTASGVDIRFSGALKPGFAITAPPACSAAGVTLSANIKENMRVLRLRWTNPTTSEDVKCVIKNNCVGFWVFAAAGINIVSTTWFNGETALTPQGAESSSDGSSAGEEPPPSVCPGAVGGVAELPEADAALLAAGDSSRVGTGPLAGVAAAIAAGAIALGGGGWYARRRWLS